MEHSLKVDWLSITIPNTQKLSIERLQDLQRFRQFDCGPMTCDVSWWRTSDPMYGYTHAYQSANGTKIMFGTPEMGVHIIYSGQALQALHSNDVLIEEIITNAIRTGARATRIDVAMDFYNGRAEVSAYATALERGNAITSAKSWRKIQNSEGGATLYVGARSSERMVRIYDKKAERAAAFEVVDMASWIRAEVEFKGDRAKNLLLALKGNDIDDALRSHLIDAIDFPNVAEWKQATRSGATTVEVSSTVRKLTKTRHWLMTTVAQTIAKEVAQDGQFYAQLMTEVNLQIERLLNGKDVDIDTNK